MRINAYCKCSMIDDGTNMSAVIFAAGCNMTCAYCHNRQMLDEDSVIDFDMVRKHLRARKGMLDSVVVSGGEPTLHRDLPELLHEIRSLGYRIKLDTNGSNPEMLKQVIDRKLVDYVAMDIKGPAKKYKVICGLPYETVERSISILREFGSYEFRTTAYPELTLSDIEGLCHDYRRDPYYLQQYRQTPNSSMKAHEDAVLFEIANRHRVGIRGLELLRFSKRIKNFDKSVDLYLQG